MKANESQLDRIIRVVLGILLISLYFAGTLTGVVGVILLAIGAIAILTGLVGFCPLYALLKIRTNKG